MIAPASLVEHLKLKMKTQRNVFDAWFYPCSKKPAIKCYSTNREEKNRLPHKKYLKSLNKLFDQINANSKTRKQIFITNLEQKNQKSALKIEWNEKHSTEKQLPTL